MGTFSEIECTKKIFSADIVAGLAMRANIGFQFASTLSSVINGDSDNDDDDGDNDSDADFTSFLQDMKKNVSRQFFCKQTNLC